jgi:anaerobic magnesium-protoporphyrin IX monomethyl ester cyclase
MDVVLVATLPDGDESLGLAYLAAALRQAGHRPRVVTFRGCGDLEEAARRACAAPAPLMGLAIPSGHAAIDVLAFLHRVRALGYRGHVTCGGAYATLARDRLLRTVDGLDSVVRHDGEIPIVRLADALSRDEALATVPGLTTRDGDGAPAPVDDRSGMLMAPERDDLRLYAGVPSAKISAVRGCWGGCRYCGLAGLRRDAMREARARGLSSGVASAAGVGGMRRRPVDHVADEMARLYHDKGVRYFHFVDENHLPRDPEQARAVLVELREALSRRRVGNRAVSLMLRADVATPEVVESLVRLGVVRCLLGVESNTPEGLAALGRGATPEANELAVRNLTRHGISFHLNVLLVHPESTLASIEAEVQALRGIEGGLLDPFQVEALEGTDLFERLRRRGQVLGGPHVWHFWPKESAARRFAEAFYLLKRQVMGQQQLTAYAYEVLGTLAVGGKLGRLGSAHRPLVEEGRRRIATHNALWLSLLEEAIAHAQEPRPGQVDALLKTGSLRAAHVTLAFARLATSIHRAANQSLRTEVFYPRTTTAVAFAAAVLAASCGGTTTAWGGGDASVLDVPDSGSSDGSDASDATTGDGPTEVAQDSPVCTGSVARKELESIRDAAEASCELICSHVKNQFVAYSFVLDAEGRVVDMELDDGEPVPPEIKECYLASVAGQVFPCLAEYPTWVPCAVALK